MSALYRIGQLLRGHQSTYTITKEIYNTVWLALYAVHKSMHEISLTFRRNSTGETVVIKGVRHSRIRNERNVLQKFQTRAPIRPLLDEILEPIDPPGIVLRYLDSDLLAASSEKVLNRSEIKYVAQIVLKALSILHEEGYVHSGKVETRHTYVVIN